MNQLAAVATWYHVNQLALTSESELALHFGKVIIKQSNIRETLNRGGGVMITQIL